MITTITNYYSRWESYAETKLQAQWGRRALMLLGISFVLQCGYIATHAEPTTLTWTLDWPTPTRERLAYILGVVLIYALYIRWRKGAMKEMSSAGHAWQAWFKKALMRTTGHVALWALALLYGGYLSVFSNELKDITWIELEGVWNGYQIGAFIGIVILTYAFSTQSVAREAMEQDKLTSIINSPPSDFLSYFAEKYDIAHEMVSRQNVSLFRAKRERVMISQVLHHYNIKLNEDALPSPKGVDREKMTVPALPKITGPTPSSKEEADLSQALADRLELQKLAEKRYEECIRRMLVSIIELVKKWDARSTMGRNVVYRANVMHVEYFDTVKGRDGQKAVDEMFSKASRFAVGPADNYTGIVELRDKRFAVKTPSPDVLVPDNRKTIAFAFTETDSGALPQHQNLLGAPSAIARRAFEYIGDTRRIHSHYKEFKNAIQTSKEVEAELEKYYLQENIGVATSLLSIPLFSNYQRDENSSLRVNWVVNVYRDQQGLLFDGERVSDFLDIIEPYLVLLRKSLDDFSKNRL